MIDRNLIFRLVTEHITNAKTLAVVSCVDRTARAMCRTPKTLHINIQHENSPGVSSACRWLGTRISEVQYLVLSGDLLNWWYFWRVSGHHVAPKLSVLVLVHTEATTLLIPSAEEFAPAGLDLQHFRVVARGPVQVGGGLSRNNLKTLRLEAPQLHIDPLALMMPRLSSVMFAGHVSTPFPLQVLQHLCNLKEVVIWASNICLVQFQTLQIESLTLVFDGLHVPSISVCLPRLQRLHLVNGVWYSDWIPETVSRIFLTNATLHDVSGKYAKSKTYEKQRMILVST